MHSHAHTRTFALVGYRPDNEVSWQALAQNQLQGC